MLSTPKFKIGDIIILDVWNIKTNWANKLIDYKNLGLLMIIGIINKSSYELKLFISISNIFSVFYLWPLYLDKNDFFLRQIIFPLPPIWFNEDIGLKKYVVEEIFNSRINKRRKNRVNRKRKCLIYKIKFTDWDK